MVTTAPGTCVLCTRAATITDWSPVQDWLTVEGCPCGDFFVWAGLWRQRFPGMPERERQELAARVRDSRAGGHEAWLSTEDGTLASSIVIFPLRLGER
jgi:hypothetical protein